MKTKLVLFLSVIFATFSAKSQVIDLSVMPLTPDSTVTGDSTNLMIQVKLLYPDSVSGIQLLFGTTEGSSDIKTGSASIAFTSGKYFASCNGELNEITDYDTRMFMRLSQQQMNDYYFMTMIVNETDGSSTTLSWKKKDLDPNN